MRYVVLQLVLIIDYVCCADILFTAFGDYGREGGTLDAVIDALNAQPKARFSVLLGDLAYPDGFQYAGDKYFKIFERFSGSADTFYAVLGNHDYRGSIDAIREYASDHSNFVFPTSGKAAYHSKKFKLSSGYGLCMLFIDTMHLEPPHIEWMHTELKQCGGHKVFRLVFGHYPIYSVGMYATCSSTKKTRDKLEPIFAQYGVHAYIGGHEHHMQALESNGRHYIISGAVGELNRNGRIRKDIHQDILKYGYAEGPAFANFRFVDDGRIEYTFRDAADGGNVLYKASIKVGDAVYIGDGEGDRKSNTNSAVSQPKNKKQGCPVTNTTGKPADQKAKKNKKDQPKSDGVNNQPSSTPICDVVDDEWEDIDPVEASQDGNKSTSLTTFSLLVSVMGLICIVV